MTTKIAAAAVLVVVALLASAGGAGAVPILTLYDTGEDNSHVVLVGGDGVADPHYTVVSGPGLGGSVSAETFKHPAYFADDADSRWISVNETGSSGGPGTYVFRTTFDLTGFDPAQTSVSVRCATDNALTSLTLNGSAIAVDCDGFGAFSAVQAISAGFIAGINTFDFAVLDAGAPMAFRAEYDGTTEPSTPDAVVPEPGTMLLIATGAVVALYRRRR